MKLMIMIMISLLLGTVADANERIFCVHEKTLLDKDCVLSNNFELQQSCRDNYGENFMAVEGSFSCHKDRQAESSLFFNVDREEEILNSKFIVIENLLKNVSIDPAKKNASIDNLVKAYEYLLEIKNKFRHYDSKTIQKDRRSIIEELAFKYHKLMLRYLSLEYQIRYELSQDSLNYNLEKNQKLYLSLHEIFAREILAKVSIKAKTDHAGFILLMPTEQELVFHEMSVLKNPSNEAQYARLFSFLAQREALNNLWAIDEISSRELLSQKNTCEGFKSFRTNSGLENIESIKENHYYSLYYSKIKSLIENEIKDIYLESRFVKESFKSSIEQFYQSSEKFRMVIDELLLEESLGLDLFLEQVYNQMIELEIKGDESNLKKDLSFIVLVGDNFTDKSKLSNLISKKIARYKYERFLNNIDKIFSGLVGALNKDFYDFIHKNAQRRKKSFKAILQGRVFNRIRDIDLRGIDTLKKRELKISNLIQKIKKAIPFTDSLKNNMPINSDNLILFLSYKMEQHPNFTSALQSNPQIREIIQKLFFKIDALSEKKTPLAYWTEVYRVLQEMITEYDIDFSTLTDDLSEEISQESLLPVKEEKFQQDLRWYVQEHPTKALEKLDSLKLLFKNQISHVMGESTKILRTRDDLRPELSFNSEITAEDFLVKILSFFKIKKLKAAIERDSLSGFLSLKEIKGFNDRVLQEIYLHNPVLKYRVSYKYTEKVSLLTSFGEVLPFKKDMEMTKEVSLLEKVMRLAYDKNNNELDENYAYELIDESLLQLEEKVMAQVESLCQLNYNDILNDDNFKKAFKEFSHLRKKIISIDQTIFKSEHSLKDLDSKVEYLLKGTFEKLKSLFFKEVQVISVLGLGFVFFSSLFLGPTPSFIFTLSSLGAASTKVALLSISLFGIGEFHAHHKLNSDFIEIPRQLQFQEVLDKKLKSSHQYRCDAMSCASTHKDFRN